MKVETFEMNNELDVFLLIGQSNMSGRGRLDEVPILRDTRISMFRDGIWTLAREPLHTDKPDRVGVGIGMSFAAYVLSRSPGAAIGLIPCAVGATPLNRWIPGTDLFENAVSITQCALEKGILRGILWHQGERDSRNYEDAASYGKRFRDMLYSLRLQLNVENVPVIAGELGAFLQNRDEFPFYDLVNRQLWELENNLMFYACVSAKGLTDNGDSVHFNSKSLRDFGIRYAKKYLELANMQ